MGAAAAVKKTRTTRKTPLTAVPSAPGSIVIPGKCKPSQGASSDYTRPVLTHAYLRRHAGSLWLCTTDSYIGVAIKVEGEAQEGYIPIGALRLMEKGQKAEQINETSWKVWTKDGTVTFDCSESVNGKTAFPDLAKVGIFDGPDGDGDLGIGKDKKFRVGINPDFMKRMAGALGAGYYGCRFEFIGQLRPIRVFPMQAADGDRLGILMPIRIAS